MCGCVGVWVCVGVCGCVCGVCVVCGVWGVCGWVWVGERCVVLGVVDCGCVVCGVVCLLINVCYLHRDGTAKTRRSSS